jgi:G3E family GTPase
MLDRNKKIGKPSPIPITVVAGFLGSGKTTLINHILEGDHGRKIAVLVNDFGSINIDAELITELGDEMVSLANGCICCSIRSDLISAVLKMADLPERPEHIVIESSGVADPEGIISSFIEPEIWGTVQLDGVITVVDAEQVLTLPAEESMLAEKQITGGDLLLLNKIDLVAAEQLVKVTTWLEELQPGIPIMETTNCNLPVNILLGIEVNHQDKLSQVKQDMLDVHVHEQAVEGADHKHDHDHDHTHTLAFETMTFTTDIPMELGLLEQVLRHMPPTVFRVKGFVYGNEKPLRKMIFQMVGRRLTVTVSKLWGDEKPQTRLVFIAKNNTVNFSAIQKALNGCKALADHRSAQPETTRNESVKLETK